MCIGPCDVELETICIGHNATSKSSAIPQHGLSDYIHSPVTECAAVAIPVDKEHLECMLQFQANKCIM